MRGGGPGRRDGGGGIGRGRGPRGLRWLAKLIVRGTDAAYVRVELDDAFERDVERGMDPWRARWRYGTNAIGSGISLWRARRPGRGPSRGWRLAAFRHRRLAIGISWLDVKLGLRMIAKRPGLTAVAVFALGIGIPVGLAPTFFVDAMEAPLPAPGGDRIKLLRYGVSARQAQAELTALVRTMAAELPAAYERLEAEVVATAHLVFGLPKGGMRTLPGFWVVHVLTLLLLVVACTNVGLLVYARAATRSSEMAVRTALGATRARIVTQVFTESLVLAVLAAGAGLLLIDRIAGILPSQIGRFLAGSTAGASLSAAVLPYWVDPGVKVSTVGWALGLAVFCAVVAGLIPALRFTGRAVQRNMRQARVGHSAFRFGGVTSALMVIDVALAVAVVGFAAGVSESLREAWAGHKDLVGFPAEEYLSASVFVQWTDRPAAASAIDRDAYVTHVAATQRALVERLEAEPGVRGGVAVASVLPRMNHPIRAVELEGETTAGDVAGHRVKSAGVDIGFFDALDRSILSGRGFNTADLREDRPAVVIVNTSFVARVLGGRNPIGRRIRLTGFRGEDRGPWLEIVGVAGRIGMDIIDADADAGVYRPLAPGEINPIRLAIHVGADPESFTARLRAIVSEVDPNAIVTMTIALDRVYEGDWYIMAAVGLGGVLLVGILLTLATSGIYAMMSFTVAQRTREIGIRTALGAQQQTIVVTVVRRAVVQLATGVLFGLPVGVKLFLAVSETGFTLSTAALSFVPGLGILVLVGLAACTAPTLRALRIDPATALREGV